MLLQSHGKDELIRLLPALPAHSDWQQGSIKGLKARGGLEVDMEWRNGKLFKAIARLEKGGVFNLQYNDKKMRVQLKPFVSQELRLK